MNKRILAIGTTVLGASLLCSAVSVAPALAATTASVSAKSTKAGDASASASLIVRQAQVAVFTVTSSNPDEYIAKAFVGDKEVGSTALSESSTLVANLGWTGFAAQKVTIKVGAQDFRTVDTIALDAVAPTQVGPIDSATVASSTPTTTKLSLAGFPGAHLTATTIGSDRVLDQADADADGASTVTVKNAEVNHDVVSIVQTISGVVGEPFFVRLDSVGEPVDPTDPPAPVDPIVTKPDAPTISSSTRLPASVDLRVRTSSSGTIIVRDADGRIVVRSLAPAAGVRQMFVPVGADATHLEVSFQRSGVESERVRVDVAALESTPVEAPAVRVVDRTASRAQLSVSTKYNVQAAIRVLNADGRIVGTGSASAGRPASISIPVTAAAATFSVVASVNGQQSEPTSVSLDAVDEPAPALPGAPTVQVRERSSATVELSATATEAGRIEVSRTDGSVIGERSVGKGQTVSLVVPVSKNAETLRVTMVANGQTSEATEVAVPEWTAPPAGSGPKVEYLGGTSLHASVRVYGPAGSTITVRNAAGVEIARGGVNPGKVSGGVNVPKLGNKTVSITTTTDGVESAATELKL
ncbi:hypothetical protein [Curtobacterium sp. Leaf261]|uniref:hypothetical protein n=1 Tax=Curtobacterium sp. Leaf261 TaxID=1736311 RepID=UPI0007146B5A|nr:hypothetical protein [Curtobacterium sp. Leaf261]KQO63761.1 hypothetical protein ASF23_05985 [Curtobacterium sp. Leaf261]